MSLTKRTLRIADNPMNQLGIYARAAGRDECMGFLASEMAGLPGPITAVCLLEAQASSSHAEANPLSIKQAADRIRTQGLRPRGIWHSHGNHGCFHSSVDNETVLRLLPAMAEWNLERPKPRFPVPVVIGPDAAMLPLANGEHLHFSLLGEEIPGQGCRTRVAWTHISTAFSKSTCPRAIQQGEFLELEADGVKLSLGIPQGASVWSRLDDQAVLRMARLFSLVVNCRGDAYAEFLEIHEFDGHSTIQRGSCDVEIVADTPRSWEPQLLEVR